MKTTVDSLTLMKTKQQMNDNLKRNQIKNRQIQSKAKKKRISYYLRKKEIQRGKTGRKYREEDEEKGEEKRYGSSYSFKKP